MLVSNLIEQLNKYPKDAVIKVEDFKISLIVHDVESVSPGMMQDTKIIVIKAVKPEE